MSDDTIPPTLQLDVQRQNGTTQVRAEGELDVQSSPSLLRTAKAALDDGQDVGLDLGAVSFVDSAGLSTLLQLLAHAERRRRSLRVTAVSEAVTTTIRMAGIDHLLPVEP